MPTYNPDTDTYDTTTSLTPDQFQAMLDAKQAQIDGLNNDIAAAQAQIASVQAEMDALNVQATARANAIAAGTVAVQPSPAQPAPAVT